jgi:methyl-accepting chemotaxis protein
VFFSIRFTHTIAGPAHKTGLILRQIAGGKLPEKKISFRTNDSFKELSDDLNQVIDSIRESRLVYKNVADKLTLLKDDMTNDIDHNQCLTQIEDILSIINTNKELDN